MNRALALLPFLVVILVTLPEHAAAQVTESATNLGAPSVTPAAARVGAEALPGVAHGGTSVGHGDVVGRVAAEASVELATVGALGVVPALIAGLSAQPCPAGAYVCLGPEFFAEFFGAIGGTIALAFMPFFVSLAGEAVGGRGDAGAAYLGMLAGGAVAGAALAGGVAANDPNTLGVMLGVGALALLAGPILGYELSDCDARRAATVTRPTTAWVPTFGVTRDGATIGIAAQL